MQHRTTSGARGLRACAGVFFALASASALQLAGCTAKPSSGGRPGDSPGLGGSAAGPQGSGFGGTGTTGGAASHTLTPLVRRLTRDEISATVSDLLGVAPSALELTAIPQDRPLEGFVNIATSQTASPEHVAGYASFARALSGRLGPTLLASHASCQEVTAACMTSFVSSVGRLLFRRPPDAEEAADFGKLFESALAAGTTFEAGAHRVVEAMLQSPQFLYRLERETAASAGLAPGQKRTITSYEMATRLAFLSWGSAPDVALLQTAETGALDTPEGVSQELNRLVQDQERVRRPTARFLLDWARLESLPESELRPELVNSLLAFHQDQMWVREAPLTTALIAPHAFLTPTLAQNLGLEALGDGVLEYDLSAAPGRRGLLAQPGMIAGMTNADGGAIVARGLFLQSQLFCGETPSPPSSLQEQIDAFVAEQPATASDRQIAEVRLARLQCGACHSSFDPLAYGLERFDFQGGYRELDEHSNALVTDGWIPARFTSENVDQPYSGLEDYAEKLAQSPAVAACLTQKHLEFALGRRLTEEHAGVVAEVGATATERGGSYRALLGAIADHPIFRELTVE